MSLFLILVLGIQFWLGICTVTELDIRADGFVTVQNSSFQLNGRQVFYNAYSL